MTAHSANTPTTRAAILAVMERMADAQLALYAAERDYPADWNAGAFYVGLSRLPHVSMSGRFLAAERDICNRHGWQIQTAKPGPGTPEADFIDHANNHCIGQMYIDVAVLDKNLAKLDPMRKQLDAVIDGFAHPTDRTRRAWNTDLASGLTVPWWWCAALFMSPPTLARLSAVTGDRKYLDTMDTQWWITASQLFDPDEHLFFRDISYRSKRTTNGKKDFWGRGNAWVLAGLTNVLIAMPSDYPSRPKYVRQFQEMAERIARLQQPDGLWRDSLLDPEGSPQPETSGAAFFCFALAWGINGDLLDRATYAPVVEKAWSALNQRIRPDGLLGCVQLVRELPASANADSTRPYAVGAFLLAGAEMIRLYGGRQI